MRPFTIVTVVALALGAQAGVAQPKLPGSAKLLKGAAISQQLANRSFKFVVHDTGFEAYGTSTWDPKQRVVYGDVVWGPYFRGPWKKEWKVTDSHSCFRDAGIEKWDCYRIYVDGATHYEVRDDGVIHSVHMPLAK